MAGGLRPQRLDDAEQFLGDDSDLVAQVGPDQGGDLVVAGPAGTQPAAELRAEEVHQAAFQGAVHVLVARRGAELAGGHPAVEFVEAGEHPGVLGVGQQARPVQGIGMGLRAGDVVVGEPPVELGGLAQREHRLGRAAAEPAAPQHALAGVDGAGG
ncbi:hypothetical protein SDC9_195948 [bioreactor metagenome]|uniref:Uncharacterized protein n=1 Tax=bioreactor metagenome TaxID=1076179 RepID=A0A645IAH2_9ZZZZ